MLNVRKDITYIYVFTGVIPALTLVIPTVTGNNVAVREFPEKIVSKTAYVTLVLAAAQARNSLIDLMAV
jgi:hypothetical protein